MRLARVASVVAFGVAASTLTTRAQTPPDVVALLKPYAKSQDLGPQTSGKIRAMMNAQVRILKTPDEKKNLETLDEFAKHYAYKVTQDKYYNPGSETGELVARPQGDSLDAAFTELEKQYLKIPTAGDVSKYTVDNADYIKEVGAAFDRHLTGLLKAPNPPIVRTNAARLLAVVSATGAPALGKTIAALIADPKTPPEVLLHAYDAAGAYLAAYDPYAVGRVDATRHCGDPADVIALIQAIERHVVFDAAAPNGPVADKVAGVAPPPAEPTATPADGTPARTGRLEARPLTPDQVKVVRYFRRHAIQALSKVRFDTLGGRNNLPEVRPAFTLARVAVADTAVSPPPSSAEYADAIAGLCGMSLSTTMNVDVLCDAIASGSIGFGLARVANPTDKTIPWRVTASKLRAAFESWKAAMRNNPKGNSSINLINSLADTVTTAVLVPLENPDGKGNPNVEAVRGWMQQNPPKDPNRQLFNDKSAYRLQPRPQ